MKENRLKRVLAEGRIPYGHMISEFATRGIARIVDTADVDFVVVDMEHAANDLPQVADQFAWFQATDIAAFVRIPQPYYHFLARAMDAGALGVMVPNVQSAQEAQGIVDAVKYAPLGKRGVGLGGAHNDYQVPKPLEYFEFANKNTTIICQIESTAGVENAEDMAAVEGVDILWVGHFDLTQSMGIPGDFQNEKFLTALKTVVDGAKKHGKHAGIQPANMAQAEQWHGIGFDVISWKADLALYGGALRAEMGALRAKLG